MFHSAFPMFSFTACCVWQRCCADSTLCERSCKIYVRTMDLYRHRTIGPKLYVLVVFLRSSFGLQIHALDHCAIRGANQSMEVQIGSRWEKFRNSIILCSVTPRLGLAPKESSGTENMQHIRYYYESCRLLTSQADTSTTSDKITCHLADVFSLDQEPFRPLKQPRIPPPYSVFAQPV